MPSHTARHTHGPRKPPDPDTRTAVLCYIRPSIKAQVDTARGKLSRSAWIERAILRLLAEGGAP